MSDMGQTEIRDGTLTSEGRFVPAFYGDECDTGCGRLGVSWWRGVLWCQECICAALAPADEAKP